MRLTKKLRTTVLAALTLTVVGVSVAAGPASAAPAPPVVAANAPVANAPVSAAGQVTPNASDTLYFCDYNIAFDNIAVWEWPGGAGRSGNHAFIRVLKNIGFNAIPWISSG